MNSDTALHPLYIEVPEVLDFGLTDFENPEITKNSMDPLIECSNDDLLDAFREATDGLNEEKKNDFSFESIFNLGPLPHLSRGISYELPSPSTLRSLPSFSMPNSKGQTDNLEGSSSFKTTPKPRFVEVKNMAAPGNVAISLPLKSSIIELRPWRSNSDKSGSFMEIPINQKDMFARINALMASKPKKPEIKKNRLITKQTTIKSFRQQKSTSLAPDFEKRQITVAHPLPNSSTTPLLVPPTPKLAPAHALMDVPVLQMPECAREVVFNRMLVCEA